jgi:hypothetical protein
MQKSRSRAASATSTKAREHEGHVSSRMSLFVLVFASLASVRPFWNPMELEERYQIRKGEEDLARSWSREKVVTLTARTRAHSSAGEKLLSYY